MGKGTPMTTLPAQFAKRPYMIQWERVLRWRTRASDAMTRDDDGFDFLLVLFANVFQMRDWLGASRPDLRSDVLALFRGSTNLGLARDLTNGGKHMTLTEYSVEGAASILREYAGAGRSRYVVPLAGGRNVEALLLADACIAEVRTFMERHDLLAAR